MDPSGHAITQCLKDAYSKQRQQQKDSGREDYNLQEAKKDAYEAAKQQVADQKANLEGISGTGKPEQQLLTGAEWNEYLKSSIWC